MKFRVAGAEIRISVLLLAVPPVLWITGGLTDYAVAFLSILLHETGHLAVAALYGCKPSSARIMPVGVSVSFHDGSFPRRVRVAIYSAGPAVSLLLFLSAALASIALPEGHGLLEKVAAVNGFLAVFNLIPAVPLDGGRILLELISERLGLLASGRLAGKLAFMAAVLISAAGIVQLLTAGSNFSLLLIGLFLLLQWKNGKMESAIMNMKQILYRQSKFLKKGIYPARDLVALKTARLDEVLTNMDFDRYHFIHVLDDDLKPVRIISETEIMEAISRDGILTLGDLIKGGGGKTSLE